MKTLFMIALTLASSAVLAQQTVHRDGYFRKDGTYVPPSYATSPNDTKLDNWSTKGNVNPYTGKEGTVDPYKIETPRLDSSSDRIKDNPSSTHKRRY